ncbi:MAG: uncharacterized protein JWP97_4059 [Labilithrix sp.]|nr:uncharacterized protein [Labilithrix sp.]
MIVRWLAAFAVTQLVEMPTYMRAQRGARTSVGRRLGVSFLASAMTHPVVWFVVPALWRGHSYLAMVLFAEAFAVLAEALWLSRCGVARALAWSVAANAASVAVGLTLRALTGWP